MATQEQARKPQRRPRRSSAERRQEVVDAARRVFLQAGYAGATVREIAAAADVNDAVLYRCFNTKEQLFEEAIAAPLEEAVTRAFRPAPGDAEVREVSETFVRDLLDAMCGIAPLLLVVLGDAERGADFYRERFQPALSRLREAIDANLPNGSTATSTPTSPCSSSAECAGSSRCTTASEARPQLSPRTSPPSCSASSRTACAHGIELRAMRSVRAGQPE
jgi:AcrR family transcriptional regulator